MSASVQASFDVHYYEELAVVGYALFESHRSAHATDSGQILHQGVEPYEPGAFYKRELPCILTAIETLNLTPGLIYIDANVWLGDRQPGLGYHLYQALDKKVPVIGISKTRYPGETDLIREVLRNNSKLPLYVSAIGIPLDEAAAMVAEMHGEYRIPTLIKLADMMSKKNFG